MKRAAHLARQRLLAWGYPEELVDLVDLSTFRPDEETNPESVDKALQLHVAPQVPRLLLAQQIFFLQHTLRGGGKAKGPDLADLLLREAAGAGAPPPGEEGGELRGAGGGAVGPDVLATRGGTPAPATAQASFTDTPSRNYGWLKNCDEIDIVELGANQRACVKISWNGATYWWDDPGNVAIKKDGNAYKRITGNGCKDIFGPGAFSAHLTGNEDYCWFEITACPCD